MTKSESGNVLEIDELPWWDVTELPDEDDELARAPSVAPYSYDSEQRTLVGIGPSRRARRSHPAAAPQSERMPQSEPPGPFIADDDELTTAPRRRRLGKRALAICLVLLVPLAAVGLLRRLSRSGEPTRESASVAVPPLASAALASAPKSLAVAADERDLHATQEVAETKDPDVARGTKTEDAAPAASRDGSEEHPQSAAPAERGTNEATPPSVRLAEVPASPAVVDRSNGDSNAGTIDVTSTPPSSVVLDGRPLGKSPSLVRAPAGAHTLVFIHPLYGRRSLSISVRPGETTTATTEF